MTPSTFEALRKPIIDARDSLHRSAHALASLTPLPADLPEGLRKAMINAAFIALVHEQAEDDPLTVVQTSTDTWVTLTRASAEAVKMPVVAVVPPDGVPRLV